MQNILHHHTTHLQVNIPTYIVILKHGLINVYLLYKVECFIGVSATNKIDNLTFVIIHDNLTCIDYYVMHYRFTALFLYSNRTIFM